MEAVENYIMGSFIIYTFDQILFRWPRDGQGMWIVWNREEVHTGFWLENLKERDR